MDDVCIGEIGQCLGLSCFRVVGIGYPVWLHLSCMTGACVNEGAETVVVTPYFLSNGRHIQEDLPRLVNEAQMLVPDVKCLLADPLGKSICRVGAAVFGYC